MSNIQVTDLRCEYMQNPLGIEVQHPRLSWRLEGTATGILQKKYHLVFAESQDALEEGPFRLDTGWVTCSDSIQIEYPGSPVEPETRIYWKVRVETTLGLQSEFSEPAYFETGISAWHAAWISSPLIEKSTALRPVPCMRTVFSLEKKVVKARLYATARGLYIPYINGRALDDTLFNPGCTNYDARILYQTYDITSSLVEGENVLGATLSTGWYAGNYGYEGLWNIYGDTMALLAQLQLTYADGTEETIISDEHWKTAIGPIDFSDLYYGERYDARKELSGWSSPGFDDSLWTEVQVEHYSYAHILAHDGEPVRRVMEIAPKELITTPAGETVINMGQNFVGWLRVTLSGKPGDVFSCDFAEVLDKDGNFYTTNLRITGMKDTYICKGEGTEIFEPSFTFHGFQYVRILEAPGEIQLSDITGIVVHTDMEQTGTFSCSDPMVTQLQKNIEWGQRGNFLDIPTDCPQRDERLGWMGDAQVFIKTGTFNFNVAPFFRKWLHDVVTEQREDGNLPVVIPNVLRGQNHPPFGSAAWGDASVICPWTLYHAYGDLRLLEETYPMMVQWNSYVTSKTIDHMWKHDFHFGDWLALDQPIDSPSCFGGTDKEQVATAFYAYTTTLLEQIAKILGKPEDEEKYRKQKRAIQEAFYNEFVTRSGRVGSNTQTAYVHALMFDLLPEEERAGAAARLVDDIAHRGFHITTGFTGAPYIMHVLSRFGYTSVAYKLLLQKEFPSWLYPVTKGATTIWERWDGIKPDGSFQTPGMNSFNHYAYGAVGDWMYPNILGFTGEQAYKKLFFTFPAECPFTCASGSYRSLYGEICSSWTKEKGTVTWSITIPPNTTALVTLTGAQYATLHDFDAVSRESWEPADSGNMISAGVGSGTYMLRFSSEA